MPCKLRGRRELWVKMIQNAPSLSLMMKTVRTMMLSAGSTGRATAGIRNSKLRGARAILFAVSSSLNHQTDKTLIE
jgi:hypothetical protein